MKDSRCCVFVRRCGVVASWYYISLEPDGASMLHAVEYREEQPQVPHTVGYYGDVRQNCFEFSLSGDLR
jgi:hypothetical protein